MHDSICAPCTIKQAQGERVISCRVSDKTCAGCALGGNTLRNRRKQRVCASSQIAYQKQKPLLLLIIDLNLFLFSCIGCSNQQKNLPLYLLLELANLRTEGAKPRAEAATYWNAFATLVFWLLELRNFTCINKKQSRSRCYGYSISYIPLVCKEGIALTHTFWGVLYANGVGVILSVFDTGFPKTSVVNRQQSDIPLFCM